MVRRMAIGGALILAALVAAPSASAGSWADLYRPLSLPDLEAGEACPVSPVDASVDWKSMGIFGSSGLGPGPVYPGLGATGGELIANQRVSGGLVAGKLFWYASPSYRGKALLRGRRLDGTGGMRFSELGPFRPALRMGPRDSIWRNRPDRGLPSAVAVPAGGCYGVQIDGKRFSRTVVFSAVVRPNP